MYFFSCISCKFLLFAENETCQNDKTASDTCDPYERSSPGPGDGKSEVLDQSDGQTEWRSDH